MPEDDQPPGRGPSPFTGPARYLLVAIVAAIMSVLIYAALTRTKPLDSKPEASGLQPASAETKQPLGPEKGLLKSTSESFRLVAKKVGPAVVNIRATKTVKPKIPSRLRGWRNGRPFQGAPGQDDDQTLRDPFFEFFGQPSPMPEESPQTSLGSGIIVDKKGIVVTNNHVIEGANEIYVNMNGDKSELKAKVLGTDAKTDLAVLKVDAGHDLPAVEWADSASVEVGDWAIAIGSPFALGQSVTVGIVSAKGGRNSTLTGVEYGGDLIQTDAAINPGNSGGPLCDVEGKVMGVNTAIYTRSGGYMGIGFAIPSNLARDVAGKLIANGKIVRGWLGVYIQPLEPELASELGIKDGVGIHEVIEGSPAAQSGLKAGDVILEVEGKGVKEVGELQRIIGNFKPGQMVKLKVISYTDKRSRNVTVKIGTLPDNPPTQADDQSGQQEEPDKLGLVVSPQGGQGVTITAVQPGSIAEQVGLQTGDVITRINRQPIDSSATYKKQIATAKVLYFEVKRSGRTLFFQFKPTD